VQERLLISGKQEGTLEVAHEALLHTWPTFQDGCRKVAWSWSSSGG